MVDSGIGRTELPELGDGRPQPRPLAEAQDGHVREPAPALPLVDPEILQQPEQVPGQVRGAPREVAQLEHAHAPGLAVALRQEPDRLCVRGGAAHRLEDRPELLHRAVTEEGQRDVQVLARDRPAAADVLGLPVAQAVEGGLGEAEGAEQTGTFTALPASGELHADSSRVCCKSRRTRCRAVTVARRRIDSRSPGKTKSAPRPPSGPSAWRYTRPTGLSLLPPPGPAIPVTATASPAPSRSRRPVAIAAAVSAETAPWRSSTCSETPSSRAFTSSPYATTPPRKTSLAPGTEVIRSATIPPVHDSAVASVSPRPRQSSSTISSIGRWSRLKRYRPMGATSRADSSSARLSAPGSTSRST